MQVGGPHLSGEAIDIHKGDGLIITGSYTPNDCLQIWDMRKFNTPMRVINWDGGDMTHGKEWLHDFTEQRETHEKLFGAANPFLYSVKFDASGELILAGGGSGSN